MKKKPIYKVIQEYLYDYINQNKDENLFLPTESELMKKFNVSRTPVRQAINILENQGLIVTQQGKGSRITSNSPIENWINMTGFSEYYQNSWDRIFTKTVSSTIITHKEYSKIFQSNSENVFFLERVRYDNDIPIIFLENYISVDIPYDLFSKDIFFSSVQNILYTQLDIKLTEATDTLEAISANEKISNFLNVQLNSPILKGTRISKDFNGNVYNVDIFYISTELWKYKSTLRFFI